MPCEAVQQLRRGRKVQFSLKARRAQDAQAIVPEHTVRVSGHGVQNALFKVLLPPRRVDDRTQFAVIQAAIEGVDAEIPAQRVHADVRGKAHGIRPMAAAVAVLAESGVFGHMPHAVLVRHMQFHGAEVRRAQHCPHLRTLAQRHNPLWPRRAAHVHIGQGQPHQRVPHRPAHQVDRLSRPLKNARHSQKPWRARQCIFLHRRSHRCSNSSSSPRNTSSAPRQ